MTDVLWHDIECGAYRGASALLLCRTLRAENESFAAACRDAGLTFIGPAPAQATSEHFRWPELVAAGSAYTGSNYAKLI